MEHYQKRKDELLPKLRTKKSTEQAIEVVQDEIKRLSNIDSDYIGGLTVPQARLASRKLGELCSTFNLLSTVGQQDLTPQLYTQHTADLVSKDTSEATTNLVMTSGGAGAIVGSLIAIGLSEQGIKSSLTKFNQNLQYLCQSNNNNLIKRVESLCESRTNLTDVGKGLFTNSITGLLLGAGIAVIFVYLLVLKKKPRQEMKTIVPPVESSRINQQSVDAILDYLQERFEAIDKEVASVDSKPKDITPKPKLEDHPDLLEFFQKLMGEAHQEEAQLPKFTRQRIDELEMFLQWHGIETEFYHPSQGKNAWSKFDFEPSLNPNVKEAITIKPALVKGDLVLLRGLVFQPS